MSNITIIDDTNIHDLVEKYLYNKDGLPEDLKIKKIGDWIVSKVTNMDHLFCFVSKHSDFNEPLNEWDVSNVTIYLDI